MLAAMHNVVLGLVRRRRALRVFSEATFGEKEANVGLAADTGTLARVPKLVGYTSLSHGLCARARLAELLLGLMSPVVSGSRSEVVRAAIGVLGGHRVEGSRGDETVHRVCMRSNIRAFSFCSVCFLEDNRSTT
jgi:hypothetical protein